MQAKMIYAKIQRALKEFYYLQIGQNIYSASQALFKVRMNAKHGHCLNCLTKESQHGDQ
jgi:hypothetical protein